MLQRCEQVMAQVCADFDATLAEFNAEEDHVHLLVQYPPKVALSHLVNSLKGASSRRLRQDFDGRINQAGMRGRFWSPSYFARSCGGAPLHIVKDNIADQKRPDQARLPPCPEGQGFRPRSPMRERQSLPRRGQRHEVTHTASFTFKGVTRFIAPLMKPTFTRLGNEAESGMASALARL